MIEGAPRPLRDGVRDPMRFISEEPIRGNGAIGGARLLRIDVVPRALPVTGAKTPTHG